MIPMQGFRLRTSTRRRLRRSGIAVTASWMVVAIGTGAAVAQPVPGDLSARFELEGRFFPQVPVDPRQTANNGSFAIGPRWELDWNRGRQGLSFEGFLRVDSSDPARTHADIRSLSWEYAADAWELRAGIRRVFWGVTESRHVVDIINQTDLVESPDGEDKLGQPMINLAWIRDWGTVDAFVMPFLRERTFPGADGRLRSAPVVNTDQPVYPDGDERIDLAVRWAHTLGDFDVGLSHYYGLSRDPRFLLAVPAGPGSAGEPDIPVLLPVYDVINQTGLDAQMTRGGWLWKFEGMVRSGQGPAFGAATGGFEYTFGGFAGGAADLGVLLEYTYDSRGQQATSLLQSDLFVGGRLALNDVHSSSVLAGGALDLQTGSVFFSLEADRRLSDGWVIEIEARAFGNASLREPLWSLRRDDYVRLAVVRYL